jgi:GNAT superfamily N-acetyltransferase
MVQLRPLARTELELIWTIDRSEVIHFIYRMEGETLTRVPDYFEAHGWPPGEVEQNTPQLYTCFDRGGACLGMFDGDQLVGAAVVDTLPRGPKGDQRQLKYLFVSRAYRGQGIGRTLVQAAQDFARGLGATALYISATPTENTVNFYRGCGAVLAIPPDPELLAEEPEDIHFICPV